MSLITSILTGGINNHETTAEEANGLSTDFVAEGIVGTIANTSGVAPATGGFAVNATGTPDTNIQISAGTAWVTATPSTQGSQTIRVKNSATITQAISANSSGSTKYDWIYLSISAANANAPNAAGDDVASITVSRSSSAATDDGTPPTYAILLAVVTVANGFSTITNSTIRDRRSQCTLGATSDSPDSFWTTGGLPAVSSVTENGNRSADITFASTVASILTPGMRIRTSRTVAAPTYMGGLFNGTNQYFTKVTPTSTLSTITDNITIMGHAEPTAYAACAIAARYDSTTANGIGLQLNASGQIVLQFNNGGGGNFRIATSYQSVPLNKKSHIAATYTSTATTFVIYLDGVSIPFAVVTGGLAPTTFGTGTNDFSIGRYGANASGYFPGYISGVGVFNAVLSASTIRSYKNQVLSGSETNCIGAWSLNNTAVNQQAAGTNDLTATNSVGYTSGRSPYCTDANGVAAGTYDWAIVTKVATTVATVQYPEGCAIPTSGGISAVDYSGSNAFGFPKEEDRWELLYINKSQASHTSPTSAVWYSLTAATVQGSAYLTVPVGKWVLGYDGTFQLNATAGSLNIFATLSTANNSESDPMYTSYAENSSVAIIGSSFYKRRALPSAITTATPYYLNTRITAGSTPSIYNRGDIKPTIIFAIPAYL